MLFLLELVVALLIVMGGVFVLVGSIGLIKLRDLMSRLHAPTKATTLGLGGVLVASMLFFLGVEGELSIHEILISVFLFITAPVSAHFMAKAWLHLHANRKRELPAAEQGSEWSTFGQPPEPGSVSDKTSHTQ